MLVADTGEMGRGMTGKGRSVFASPAPIAVKGEGAIGFGSTDAVTEGHHHIRGFTRKRDEERRQRKRERGRGNDSTCKYREDTYQEPV